MILSTSTRSGGIVRTPLQTIREEQLRDVRFKLLRDYHFKYTPGEPKWPRHPHTLPRKFYFRSNSLCKILNIIIKFSVILANEINAISITLFQSNIAINLSNSLHHALSFELHDTFTRPCHIPLLEKHLPIHGAKFMRTTSTLRFSTFMVSITTRFDLWRWSINSIDNSIALLDLQSFLWTRIFVATQ